MMSETINIAGREIEVKQLNMRQIRDFIAGLNADAEPHIVDVLFDDPVPARAVSMATGLSLDELAGDYSQEDMRGILDKVKAMNPFFVGMMGRIIESGRQLSES